MRFTLLEEPAVARAAQQWHAPASSVQPTRHSTALLEEPAAAPTISLDPIETPRQHHNASQAMDPQDAVDLGRQALLFTMLIASPVLLAGMVVGLVIGLLQAVTQIHEQTVAFVPKLIVMVLVLSVSLPWLVTQMVQFSRDLILNIPQTM